MVIWRFRVIFKGLNDSLGMTHFVDVSYSIRGTAKYRDDEGGTKIELYIVRVRETMTLLIRFECKALKVKLNKGEVIDHC